MQCLGSFLYVSAAAHCSESQLYQLLLHRHRIDIKKLTYTSLRQYNR